MPKVKTLESSSSANGSGSDSDSGPEDRTPVVKNKKSKREESSDSEAKPAVKKAKTDASSSSKKSSKNGETTWELDDKKRVTVRSFKGKTYIDIREFYEAKGQLLPGKKGISLTVDLWKKLMDISSEITDAI